MVTGGPAQKPDWKKMIRSVRQWYGHWRVKIHLWGNFKKTGWKISENSWKMLKESELNCRKIIQKSEIFQKYSIKTLTEIIGNLPEIRRKLWKIFEKLERNLYVVIWTENSFNLREKLEKRFQNLTEKRLKIWDKFQKKKKKKKKSKKLNRKVWVKI